MNILSNFSSQALTVWDRQCLEDSERKDVTNHDRLNQSFNDKGVYETAPATLVLLNILKAALVTLFQFFLNLNDNVVKLDGVGPVDNSKGGGTICYFSVDIRDRFPGPMVLDAFCHNKTENNFENFEN